MKKISFWIIILMLIGCSKLDEIKSTLESAPVFTAILESAETGSSTKTYLDENIKILWNAEDELSIFSTTLNERYSFDGETGDNSGTFTKIKSESFGAANDILTNYAIYPYDEENAIQNDESYLTVPLYDNQTYVKGSVGIGANVAVAVTDGLDDFLLKFKNACSYIQIRLYGDQNPIKTITLQGSNNEKLAGTAKVTINSAKEPIISLSDDSNATGIITLTCNNDGVKIGLTEDEVTSFWIALPPTTFTKGFTLTIADIAGNQMIKNYSSSFVFSRNKYKRATFEFIPTHNINKQKERNALVALYNSLGGDGWTNKTNWLDENVEVSEWYGVTVDSEGFVTGIDLSNNNLSGTIPDEIGDFSKLVTLCFGDYLNNQNNNNITGTLPESICKLTSLEYLDLSSNQLEGALPENIGNLSKMNQLFLNNNQFTGSIPESIWTGMKQLGLLWLSGNKFTGGLTSSIGNATSLSELRATYNSFSSPLPAEICNLTNLGVLELSSSGITGAIPDNIGNMKNLQFMWLRGNNLSGSIPGSIGEMTNLIDLDLRQNSLRESVPDAIGELKNLNKLLLSDNMFSGTIPSTIGGCTNLTDLDISLNRIEGEIPESLGTCTKLMNLNLSFNRLGGEVIDFEPLVNLKKLYLDYNTELGGTISGKVLNNLSDYSIDGTKIGIEKDTGLQDPVQGGENMPWE